MTTYRATILGGIWWPYGAECSTERTYRADDDEEAVEKAQTTEAGDFSSVKDVMVLAREQCDGLTMCPSSRTLPHTRERMVKDWDNEDNEIAYLDTISQEDN